MKDLLRRWLADYALRTGRLTGLYRRICRPHGIQWAAWLKRHGGLFAMGERCVIQSNVTFTDPPHVRLGNNVHLTGCMLFGHDGSVSMLKKMTGRKLDSVGKVDIRDNVFVGHQAIIMPGVTIGPNAIVGAGALVTRDVAPNTVVGGVPARVIAQLDEYIDRVERRTAALPWADHPGIAPTFMGPADAELTRLRVAHFFGAAGADTDTDTDTDGTTR